MAHKAKKPETKKAKPSAQLFHVPSIGKSIEANDLSEVAALVAKDKTKQEEVGDGNS